MIFKIILNRIVSFVTINAFLWDHDGTLFDTQKYHAIVESMILATYGIIISAEEITRRFSGVKTRDFFLQLFSQHKIKVNIDEVMTLKWKMMIEIIEKNGLNFMPGAEWLVKIAKLNGIKQVIGSASNREFINFCLNKKGIAHYFLGIVSGEDVKNGKPNPETWIKCAKLANTSYDNCFVFEDGDQGIKAAKALKILTFRIVLPEYFGNEQKTCLADFVTNDFSNVSFLRNSFTIPT